MGRKRTSAADDSAPGGVRLAAHPRALRHIRLARAWAGLIGFALAALAAGASELSAFDVGLRALAGGVAGCLAGWTIAVAVWRQLALAELNALAARLLAAASAPPPAPDDEFGPSGR